MNPALEQLADMIATRLGERHAERTAEIVLARLQPLFAAESEPIDPAPDPLVDVATIARELGVSKAYVYEHADELGALRRGTGPRPRLRFDLEEARAAFVRREAPAIEQRRQQSRPRPAGGTVPLLPVKGGNRRGAR